MQHYPVINLEQNGVAQPQFRPISFVTVHFSGDYFHNLLISECVHDPRNQLITIDNRSEHRFDTLSAAINAGLDKAVHDLVAVVHEDVVLVRHWQERLIQSLQALEATDPDWGLVGSVGWDSAEKIVGHWSDPHRRYGDTLGDRDFAEVRRLDERILIFRRSAGLRFDDMLPSIHNIGRDVSSTLAQQGRKTYAVNAPTIHKYADHTGAQILDAKQSDKIQKRTLPANQAEWRCSDAYLHAKWPEWVGTGGELGSGTPDVCDAEGEAVLAYAEPPVIALARGGSGSRLLSTLLQDLGVWLGPRLNRSGDTMNMVDAIYRGVLSTYQNRADWQRAQIVPRLRAAAADMLAQAPRNANWGFKLPESILISEALDLAFPGARYVHLIRDPLATCLRRTHLTARFDNAIGRTAIRAAYVHCGRPVEDSLSDSPALHMAYTTRHQIETARAYAGAHLQGRYTEIRFEEILAAPRETQEKLAGWLGVAPVADMLSQAIDTDRAAMPKTVYDGKTQARTAQALQVLREALGYC